MIALTRERESSIWQANLTCVRRGSGVEGRVLKSIWIVEACKTKEERVEENLGRKSFHIIEVHDGPLSPVVRSSLDDRPARVNRSVNSRCRMGDFHSVATRYRIQYSCVALIFNSTRSSKLPNASGKSSTLRHPVCTLETSQERVRRLGV